MNDPYPKDKPDLCDPFIYSIKCKHFLKRNFLPQKKDFYSVIENRKSTRDFSRITFNQLEEMLFHISKITSINIDKYNYITTKRTVPSAGARHPIDILVSLPEKQRKLNYYNPLDHSLNELCVEDSKLVNFYSKINENLNLENACIIWFAIQINKTASKYNNPESLYWKDTGILLYHIQLISSYLGLKSCPLGTLASEAFNQLFEEDTLISGGGILIGN